VRECTFRILYQGLSERDSHGRDNKLHIWRRPERAAPIQVGASATAPALSAPVRLDSMEVNALNYCRFSLLPVPETVGRGGVDELWLALPNLVESACVRHDVRSRAQT
jgi:hypothetical protein